MKKKILLFFCAIILTISVSAQYKEIQLGLVGQPGYSILSLPNEKISDVRDGFSYKYGLFGTFYFNENYGFSSGIIVKSFGSGYKMYYVTPESESVYTHNFVNTYLQVPLLFKGRTDAISKFRILGEFGLGLDFLLDESSSYNIISGTACQELKYRTFCPSLMIGIGTEFNIYKSSSLIFQVVLDKGFTNLIKTSDLSDDYSSFKMSCLYFEVGFIF